MTESATYSIAAQLLRRWRLLAAISFLGLAAGVAYGFLTAKWYSATLTVVQSQRSQESAATALASRLPAGLGQVSSDVERIRAVLVSNSVVDQVIDRFKLMQRYEMPYREKARAALLSHCSTSADKKSGVVVLTCEDREPEMAKAMAEYFGEVGNQVFGRVSTSSAREERKFLQSQVEIARKNVEESSRKLREFQEKNKIIDLPEQSKAVISAMASIQGDLISKQLELSYLGTFSSRTEVSVVQLQQQIRIMEEKLAELETERSKAQAAASLGSGAAAGSGAFFPNAMVVPSLRFELEQVLRQQKIDETIYALLIQRYEMAKVDEARDTSTFQILDYPTVPTYHSRPKKTKTGFTGLAGGLMLGSIMVLFPIWRRRLLELRS